MESASGEVPSDPQLPTGRLRIPRCCLPPRLIQKRFISDISHVETETLNLILDPPCGGRWVGPASFPRFDAPTHFLRCVYQLVKKIHTWYMTI